MSEWLDDLDEEIDFEPIVPGEVTVTDPEPTGLLGPDGEELLHDRVPFGFQRP